MKKSNNFFSSSLSFMTIFAIACLFSIIFFFPILANFTTHLTSRADGVFISWTIFTVSDFLLSGQNIFQMPLYFPYTNTLSYSDPFISTALLSIPLLFFTKNIVLIHNFHLIIGAIVLYISSYFLGKQLRLSNISSHFIALIFAFSSIQISYIVHLHTYLIAGLPLSFLFILKWLENNKWHWLFALFSAFLYQALNSPMTGFFIIFAMIPFIFDKKNLPKILTKIKKNKLLFSYYMFFSLVLIAIVYIPYFITAQQFEYTRTIRDAAHFAFSINRFFQTDLLFNLSLLLLLWKTRFKKNDSINSEKRNNNSFIKSLKIPENLVTISKKNAVYIAIIGAVLMLGPVLKINDQTLKIFDVPLPLPYAVLYYIIPGFQAFRASSRWILLLNFALALLFGYFVQNSKLKEKFLYFIFGILLFTQLYFHYSKFEIFEIPTKIPEIYSAVKNLEINKNLSIDKNDEVIAEFPVFSWRMMPYAYLENDRLLYQSYHKKKLYNGVSGFTPPQREKDLDWLWNEFPGIETIKHLNKEGVKFILVHYDLYLEMFNDEFSYKNKTSPDPTKLLEEIQQIETLQLIECKQNKCLYKISKLGYENQYQ